MAAAHTIKGERGYLFQNWSQDAKCRPRLYYEPENREHIEQILLKAAELSRHVRVVGSGHSNNDQACTTDYLVSLKKMNNIIKIDKSAMTVKVEGGAKIKEINDALAENGLGLSIFGSAANATVAGSVSTGTHRTGLNYKCISAYVLEMELMTADGNVHTISRDLDEDLYRAAVVSVGTMGIILTLTLQCEPAFNLEQKHIEVDLDDVLDDIVNIAGKSEHTELTWSPYAGTVIKYTNRTTKTEPKKQLSYWRHIIFGGYLVEFFYWLSTFFSSIVPWINRMVFKNLLAPPSTFVGRNDQVLSSPAPMRCHYTGWSVPLEMVADTLKELRDWVYEKKFPAHMMVNIVFVGKDDLYLSMANGRAIGSFTIIMTKPYGKCVDYQPYWQALQEICLKKGGKFHWSQTPNLTPEEISHVYPDLEKFHKIRKVMDPNGTFLTPEVSRMIGA